jgi:hypothetical protein
MSMGRSLARRHLAGRRAARHHPVVRQAASVAPAVLDPILAAVERIDRALRRIRPIRPGGLLGLERHRHRGAPVILADGTRVTAGDRAWIIHFDNAVVRRLPADRWLADGYRLARDDLQALAAWHAAQPPDRRPVAYTGVTVLGALARRVGFEVHPTNPGWLSRLQGWYLRSLLARWARAGRARLDQGRRPLRVSVTWISGDELLRRHLPPARQVGARARQVGVTLSATDHNDHARRYDSPARLRPWSFHAAGERNDHRTRMSGVRETPLGR